MPTEEKTLTQLEIVRAATNDPALAARTVKLGDREFPVLDLEYDDYMLFMAQVTPLLESLLGSLPGVRNLQLVDTITPSSIISFCGKSLPELARIVCSQSAPAITVAEVKKLGKTPFALALVVLAQIEQNQMITSVKDFFLRIAPLLTAVLPSK